MQDCTMSFLVSALISILLRWESLTPEPKQRMMSHNETTSLYTSSQSDIDEIENMINNDGTVSFLVCFS